MLHLSALRGDRIEARDGAIGSLKDMYFDARWSVRYLAVDTGAWLPDREVLISPTAIGEASEDAIRIELTCEQVKHAPSRASNAALTRQFEEELARRSDDPSRRETDVEPIEPMAAQLCSAAEMVGYRIEAADGPLGHVEDLLIDESDWCIADMIVETRNWLPGRKVAVPPAAIQEVDWAKSTVRLRLTREELKAAPQAT